MQGNRTSGRMTKSALVGTTAMMAGLAFAGMAGAAYAQSSDQSTVKEVVVTGSRIARRDFTSNSPIVTVTSQSFQNTANVAVEATLNKLPQFTPDQNMTGGQNSGDVQPTANHSVGISTLSLRGLGPNRNLVLEDGRRLVPSNGELIVDVNAIPSAMIDHVEVITGGASAVYGADAVAGVINFVMKKNFQGMDVDTQYGITQAGDGKEFKASVFMGANFADDKGNVSFGLEHYTRSPSLQANRDFYTKGWADPNTPTNEFFATGNSFQPDATNGPSQAAVSSLFTHGFVPATNQAYYFNADGTLYTGAANAFVPGLAGAAGPYRYNRPVDG
jgi:iron complex outermembrane receptor protein